jgi:hypothetical protein
MKPTDEKREAIDPTVRAILDDVIIQDDGLAFVDNYVSWIMALRKLSAKENPRIFLQLAVLARQFFDADCKTVALSLAALARIGLDRLVKQKMRNAPR